jgi:hypothetical protein
MAVSGVSLCQTFVERKNADLAIVRWVEKQAPPAARLITFNLTLAFRHYSHLATLELYELGEEDLQRLATDQPTFLLVDVANVEEQWRNMPLADSYHWLRDVAGLHRLGQERGFTLFRVAGGSSP